MRYRPDIDGLRALAVLPVILYHAGFPAFGGGYVGVDVFFVISGYLITTIIADEIAQGRFSLWRFYERRARRILPVLFLVILTGLPFAWLWLMPRDMETYAHSILAVATFTSNFFFWSETGYFETNADLQPLLHTWSLAVEEQYYILFPLFMLVIWRRSPAIILGGLLLASFFAAERALNVDPAAAFFLLPTRAWELAIGALAALHLRKPDTRHPNTRICDGLSALGVALIAFAVVTYDDRTHFPGLGALPPTIGTLLVILFAREGGVVHRCLGLGPVVAVGLISYGAYLWHQPVFALVQHRFGSVAFSTYALPLIAMSFALAYAGYVLVEQPFRKRLSVKTLTWSVLASAALSIGVAVVMYVAADRNPHLLPSYKWAVAHADAELLRYVERRGVFMECGEGADDTGLRQCEFGDPGAPRTLVLWGDSLAQALLSGMHETAQEDGVGGLAFIANGCPPVPGLQNAGLRECRGETHNAVLTKIEALPDVRDVVITGNLSDAISAGNVRIDGGPTSYGAVREKLASALARLRSIGIHVVMLEQGPTFPEDVSSYLLQNMRHGHLEPPEIDRADYLGSLQEVRRLADLVDRYVETTDIFCGDETCPAVDQHGQLVIFDRNHVTRRYAAELSRHLFLRADFQSVRSGSK